MGVQQADQDEVDEEALDAVLALGQVAVVEIGADDRDVVGQVPRARRRLAGEATDGSTLGDEAGPGWPRMRERASQVSRSSRSFTALHHGLPGRS